MPENKELSLFEAEEKMGRLLGSQDAFMRAGPKPYQDKNGDLKMSDTAYAVLEGGWGCGKTRIMCQKGVVLSALFPGNEGIIGRYRGSDLQDSTIPAFFEVCPPSWLKKNGWNKQSNTVTFKNESKVYFRHIHDPNAKGATKTRRVGANLGWFGLDQLEEMDIAHWNSLVGRLRNPKAKIKMGMATANPNGRDWVQKMFFPDVSPLRKGEFFREQRQGNMIGIMIDSNENRLSNGGFVEDSYYDNLFSILPADWYNRYVLCSFDDFTGKIYKGYTKESVHNVKPFAIPKHWECVVTIDVGGDCPWAVVPHYIDEWGNIVITNGFHKATGRTSEVAAWIKTNVPWNDARTTFIIDPENKLAMVDLQDYGIHCRIAQKAVLPGIKQAGSYFHVDPKRLLPSWYFETQPEESVKKFKAAGSPRIFMQEDAEVTRTEHDEWVWDSNKKNTPLKTNEKRFDTCDAVRYAIMSRPQAAALPAVEDKYSVLRIADPMAAREWEALDKRLADMKNAKGGSSIIREAWWDGDEHSFVGAGPVRGYDWGDL